MTQPSLNWWSSPRALLRHVLTLDDTAHSVALGTAIGMFIALTPTVGIQMLLVLVTAALLRPLFTFNRIAALVTVYVSNPLTVVPIYWFNYRVGTLLFPATVERGEFARLLQYDGLAEWWRAIVALFVQVGAPLLAGSLVVGAVCGLLTYPLMRLLHNWFHDTTDRLAEARAVRRQRRRAGGGNPRRARRRKAAMPSESPNG